MTRRTVAEIEPNAHYMPPNIFEDRAAVAARVKAHYEQHMLTKEGAQTARQIALMLRADGCDEHMSYVTAILGGCDAEGSA